MNDRTITADDCETAILAALKDGNIPAVYHYLKVMAVLDPLRAESLMDALKLGLELRNHLDAGEGAL